MNAKVLFFIQLCLLKRVLTLHDECDGATANSRMSSIIILKPSVYTALQCEDKCFREASCDGFNFKPIGTNGENAECELFKANSNVTLSQANGFSSRWLNRTKIREKWLGKSCGKCNERQQCSRDIDKCNPYPCKCRKGYMDDGNETCYPGCTDNALLTQSQGNISTPTYCVNSGQLLLDIPFTCLYAIQLAGEKNVTIHFSEFFLKFGNAEDCRTALLYVEFYHDEQLHTKKCGNMGSFSIHLIGKVIAVKVVSEPFSTLQGNKLNGFYRVGEIL